MNSSAPINNQITVAVCSYNAARYLPKLLEALIAQDCPIPFGVLIVDNNSTDNTRTLVGDFAVSSRVPVRYIHEPEQGITFARNRAIVESLTSRYLAFIDADELPEKNWLQAAVKNLHDESVDCVGGRITISLPHRPHWLSNELLPFYGEVNHSSESFKIKDRSTPIWSGNIAYNTRLFQHGLRFDSRYNRKGKGIGGGSDGIMFQQLLQQHRQLVYEPDMVILHLIPEEKIKRRYFLKLHYLAGKKEGLYALPTEGRKLAGIPYFMFVQLLQKIRLTLNLCLQRHSYMRAAMNVTYQLGMMYGLALTNFKKNRK